MRGGASGGATGDGEPGSGLGAGGEAGGEGGGERKNPWPSSRAKGRGAPELLYPERTIRSAVFC